MVRALRSTLAAASVAGALFALPALACEAHKPAATSSATSETASTAGAGTQPAAARVGGNVLAPVDEVLAATCNCGSASDCTCKKGECRCKKCQQNGVKTEGGSTRLMEPLKNQQRSPEVPQNARHDATAGVLI